MQTDPVGYEDQMNLYAYVGNDPLNFRDPTGEAKVSIGFSAQLVIKGGLKVEGVVSFDTKTLEVGAKGVLGGRFGYAAGLGVIAGIEGSGDKATNSIQGTVVVNAEANLGPTTVTKDIITGTASSTSGVQTVVGNGESGGAQLKGARIDTGTRLGLGATIGVDSEVEATTSVISDVVDGFKNMSNIGNRSDQGMSGAATKICSGMGAQKGGC